METKSLEKIGLTKNESLIYMTLLQLGTSKTGKILKKSNLNSGKIYEILESLKIKGLVSESMINKIKHFTASSPVQLLKYLERKKAELNKEENTIRALLPTLEKQRKISIKETISITYLGFRGIQTAVDEISETLKPHDEILSMGITEHKDERFNKFWEKWSKKRIQKKIIAKHIFSEEGTFYKKIKSMEYTEAKVLKAFTPATVDIYGTDKVLILNYPEPTLCIFIYNKNIATSFRQFFNQLWRIAK